MFFLHHFLSLLWNILFITQDALFQRVGSVFPVVFPDINLERKKLQQIQESDE
jgi:hypothetical protein